MEIEKCKRGSSAKVTLSQEKLKVPLEPGFLGFTFVPSFGRLPTQCYLADCTTFCKEVIAETKELEKPSAIGSGNKGSGEAASWPNNKHKPFKRKEDKAKGGKMDGNDLFKAEFVLITDSDEDAKAILGNGYGHERSRISAASPGSSGDEWEVRGSVPQLSPHTDLPRSSASQQKHSQLTSPLSTSDHLFHKSPAAPLLSPTNLEVEHEQAVPGLQASQQESHSRWRSADGSCIHQTSTYFQSTTSSSLPSSILKIPPSPFDSRADSAQLSSNVQTHKLEKEFTPLLTKDSCPPSQVPTSADALESSSPQAYSPLPSKKLVPWPMVPIYITTHVLSPSPNQLPPSLHGSSSDIYNVNHPCSQMSSSGNLPVSGIKSPLPTRLSLLTAILKSGSSPKRPFSPASCPATFSPNSLDSSTLAIEQKFKSTPPTPKKSASHFSIRSSSPCQDGGHLSVFSNAPSHMISSKSSPTLQTWSLSPKRTLDTRTHSPDKLRPLSPTISSHRKTVVSPLLKPKLTNFSLPPHVPRQGAVKTREPEKSTKVHSCSPTFTAKSYPVPTLAVNQRDTISPTAQKLTFSPTSVHSGNQPKEYLLHVSAKDRDINSSVHWPFCHQDSTSSIPLGCNINNPVRQTHASPLHSNFRACPPCSRNKTPTVTPHRSLARKHSPCSQLSRSRQASSPLSFSLPSDCENKTPKSYKINTSYKTFAAIPTNTLLLEQKALNEQIKTEPEVEDRALDTHSEMCSPAQLRQQTEELCAAIDQVLQEPLTRRRCNSSPSSLKNVLDSNTGKTSAASQRPAGRETKYANLYLTAPAVTETQKIYILPFLQELKEAYLQQPCETKPGVIRPTTVKAKIIVKEEESVQPNPFRKFLEERSGLQTEQTTHPIVPIPENEALSSKELSSVRRKDKLPYHEDLSEGNFLDNESPHQRGHCPLRGDPRNSSAKLS